MKKEIIKSVLVKEAASQGYNLGNLNAVQEAYLDGLATKLASTTMTKEALLPAAIPLIAKLVTGGLAAYSAYNAGKSLYQGNYGDAALNALGAIPGVGLAGKALGWGSKFLGGAGLANKALNAGTKMTDWAGSGKMLPFWGGAGAAMTHPVSTAAGTAAFTALPWAYDKMTGGGQQPQQQAQPQAPAGYYPPQQQQQSYTGMH